MAKLYANMKSHKLKIEYSRLAKAWRVHVKGTMHYFNSRKSAEIFIQSIILN